MEVERLSPIDAFKSFLMPHPNLRVLPLFPVSTVAKWATCPYSVGDLNARELLETRFPTLRQPFTPPPGSDTRYAIP